MRWRRGSWTSVGLATLVVGLVVSAGACGSSAQVEAQSGSTVATPPTTEPDLSRHIVVFVDVNATDATISTLRQSLLDDPTLDGVRYVTPDESMAEFRCLFASSPAMLESVTVDILPTSFRVTPIAEDGDVTAIEARLRSLPGVRDVTDTFTPGRDWSSSNPDAGPSDPRCFEAGTVLK